jgi:hypothetical protein
VKYTNYIISDKPLDFEGVGVMAIPAVMFAVPALVGLLGGAVLMDGGRILKLKYLLFKKQQRKLNYIRCVIRSLDRVETRELINLLKAA